MYLFMFSESPEVQQVGAPTTASPFPAVYRPSPSVFPAYKNGE